MVNCLKTLEDGTQTWRASIKREAYSVVRSECLILKNSSLSITRTSVREEKKTRKKVMKPT
jgi:hypothetical protein